MKNKKRFFSALAVILAVSLLVSQMSIVTVTAGSKKGDITKTSFRRTYADVSVELLKKSGLKDIKAGKNVLISPESILCAMTMSANGAANNTLVQYEDVLMGGYSLSSFNRKMKSFNKRLTSSKKVSFNIANSIWLSNNAKGAVKPEFINVNKKNFGAEIDFVDFNMDTVERVNKWVSKNTNGMIDKIVDRFAPDTVSCIVNAIAFEAKWAEQYSEYSVKKGRFTNAQGTKEKVNMLYGTEYKYISDENSTGFIKDYEGGDYAFMAVLPKKGMTLLEYIKKLNGNKFTALYHGAQNCEVLTKMPEFSYDYSAKLNNPIKKMGITDAFSQTEADFGNMLDTSSGANVYIDEIIHKTHIELDRYGTKAAAATGIINKETCVPGRPKPKKVYLTRPFLYAIVDTDTGLPVFVGVVNTVK